MTIALFASEQISLQQIALVLQREGVNVAPFVLQRDLNRNSLRAIDKIVLIAPDRGVVNVGEKTEFVRELVGAERRLILCAPQPTASGKLTLMDCGASEIIEPQSWSAEHIAIRILGQLIHDRDIQTIGFGALRGATRQMRELYSHIEKLAPLSEPILVRGETGTGKELVAGEIHKFSKHQHAYLSINCPEINPELISSELFGHRRGSFTGADKDRVGLIASVGKGTIFLDEIGDLDLQSQAKLLRVLEDHKVRRVGANHTEDVHARVILATNRNLENACDNGKFREDLFERIRGLTLTLPPLRERKGDIPLLASYFVEKFNKEYGSSLKILPEGIDFLFRHDWPGNVRELRAVIMRAAAYADDKGNISNIMLQESIQGRAGKSTGNAIPFDPALDTWRDVQTRAQSMYFRSLLAQTNGNKEAAIKLSGLSRSQFFEKIKEP